LTAPAIRRDNAPRLCQREFDGGQEEVKETEPVEAALDRAFAALQRARPDEAVRLAQQVLAQAPGHRRALSLLGVALLVCGRGADAVAPLTAAADGAADAGIEANLAMALTQAQRFDEAVAHLERAIALKPDFATAYQKLALLHNLRERPEAAEDAATRATALAPADPEAWAALGTILLDRGKSREAIEALTRALAGLPGLPDLLHPLAGALMDQGDFAAAEGRLREVLAHARVGNYPPPKAAMARLDLGYCLQELGRWDEALPNYRMAVEQSPQLYSMAVTAIVSSSRGRFWLKPSEFAKILPRPLPLPGSMPEGR
jgi:tetratricopeptide (TPR) repeat protein